MNLRQTLYSWLAKSALKFEEDMRQLPVPWLAEDARQTKRMNAFENRGL